MKCVYFAGKVGKGGWRDRLLGPRSMSRGEFCYRKSFKYVGPFAISCDHGCCHQNARHGSLEECCSGIISDEQVGLEAMSPHQVVARCLGQVKRSNLVVVYLDCDDCPGTMVELGFALALQKPILLFHENPIEVDLHSSVYPVARIKDELWFAKHASGVECHRGPVSMDRILTALRGLK